MKLKRVVGVLLFLAWACVVRAQPLADRIPADALVYIGWAGSEHMGAGYAQSHLKGMLDASKFPQLINESLPRLFENLGHQDQDAAEALAILSAIGGPVWRHPSALYFAGIDLSNPDAPMPKLAILCDAGKEGPALAEQVRKLIEKGARDMPYKVEEQGGMVVVSFGKVEISAAKKPALAIPAKKEFASAMAKVGKEPVVALYVDVEGAIEQLEAVLKVYAPPEATQKWGVIREAIGLSSLKRIVMTGGFDGREWANHFLIESPEPRTGLVGELLKAEPISESTLKAIPQSATIAMAGHLDLGGLLGEIRKMVRMIDVNASADFEAGLESVKQAIGMDLQGEILDTLGDEWALYVDPGVGGNGLLGLTVVNKLKDPAKAEKALTQLELLANSKMKEAMQPEKFTFAFKTTRQGDLTIHYLSIPGVAPAWAIKHGNLYLALYPQMVSGAADHVASKGKSILENSAFVAMRKRLGVENATAVQFVDLPKTTAEGYAEVLMVVQAWLGSADLLGARTPALAMPPLAKLLPHVTPEGSAAWVDKDGWHMKTIVPFPGADVLSTGGMGTLFSTYQAASTGLIVPMLTRERAMMREVERAHIEADQAHRKAQEQQPRQDGGKPKGL